MVPLQAPTGQLEVIPLQDISDFCICASVHFMRTYTSYQCCLTELKRSEIWLQWHHTWASQCKKFHVEVLLYF